jgi:endonuclease/exonuclease/phosphatase (EEP) superfamily protein YafD
MNLRPRRDRRHGGPTRLRGATARLRRLAGATALGAVAAGVLLPDRLRLGDRYPFVDFVAWRPHASAAALLTGAVLATRRGTRPTAAALGTVAAVGLVDAARQHARPEPPVRPATGTELTVLALNVRYGRTDTGELATLIERSTPDFVVMPEAGPDFCDKVMALVEILGYRSWVSTEPGARDGESVTLLVGPRAGDVQVRAASTLWVSHLEVTGGLLGGRTLYAVHPVAPVGPAPTAAWRRDLAVLARWCRAPLPPIVAGDFNATMDHVSFRTALGGCRSAAAGTGRGLIGTFPARLPRWFGIQIDHVLIPADAVTRRFEILDVAGSDHRAVLATVDLPRALVACSSGSAGL